MTEKQWLRCKEPWQLLDHLEQHLARAYKRAAALSQEGKEDPQAKAAFRKLRLFGAAGCRRLWHLLEDRRCRNAVKVIEQQADDLATPEELFAAADEVEDLCPSEEDRLTGRNQSVQAVWRATYPLLDDFADAREAAGEAARAVAYAAYPELRHEPEGNEAEKRYQEWQRD